MIRQKNIHHILTGFAVYVTSVLSCLMSVVFAADSKVQNSTIKLLQPLGPDDEIAIGPGFTSWFDYFNNSAPWLYNVAIGICVLWILVGGLSVMISGDNPQLAKKGKGFMIGSLAGLVMLILAPVILRTLNGLFFV